MPRWSAEKPAVAIVATGDDYDEGYHKGNVGGLDAVDTDLAPGHIEDGVTIFGKLGTFVGGPLAEDVLGSGVSPTERDSQFTNGHYYGEIWVPANGTLDMATTTPDFTAGSLAVGSAFLYGHAKVADKMKFQLVMGGTVVGETAFLLPFEDIEVQVLVATRALSGLQACVARLENYTGENEIFRFVFPEYGLLSEKPSAVAVGSVKI